MGDQTRDSRRRTHRLASHRLGSAVAAMAVLAGVCLVAPTAAGAQGDSPTVASTLPPQEALLKAVSDGRIDRAVADAVATSGSATAVLDVKIDVRNLGLQNAGTDPQTVAGLASLAKAAVFGTTPGLTVVKDYDNLPTALVRISGTDALAALAGNERVRSVNAEGRFSPQLEESLQLIRQPAAAAAGNKGAGTAVAILDTGVDVSRPEFGSCSAPGESCRVVESVEIAPDDGEADDSGRHGTNVAAIAASVAPEAKIIVLDVFSGRTATDRDIIAGIDWVIANRSKYGITAMNLSLGDRQHVASACPSDPYTGPFAAALAVGVAPVVASGNGASVDGKYVDGVSSPACAPGAVAVGAVYDDNVGDLFADDCGDQTTTADQITCFSQSGSRLDILAPGSAVTAGGVTKSGTSQAAPHVAGAIAVLRGTYPNANLPALLAALKRSGPAITDSRNGVQRHRLDLFEAVDQAKPVTYTVSGTITDNTLTPAGPAGSAFVQACNEQGSCFTGRSDDAGAYGLTITEKGSFAVMAYPGIASSARPSASVAVPVTEDGSKGGVDLTLEAYRALPSTVTITPSRKPNNIVVPMVSQADKLTISTTACVAGTGTYEFTLGGAAGPKGSLTAAAGTYTASVPALGKVGPATLVLAIDCAEGDDVSTTVDLVVDPGGVVRSPEGSPIGGAKVTLLRSESAIGPFEPVNASYLSPVNRSNPDSTDALGRFGWDAPAGYYQVTAEMTGCRSPDDPTKSVVTSVATAWPPTLAHWDLRLDCTPPPTPDPDPDPTVVPTTGRQVTPTTRVSVDVAGTSQTSGQDLAVTGGDTRGPVGWGLALIGLGVLGLALQQRRRLATARHTARHTARR